MPMEERIKLFEKLSASIQAEIRGVLEAQILIIAGYLDQWPRQDWEDEGYPLMGHWTRRLVNRYYSPDKVDRKMESEDMGPWIANLVAGYILEELLPLYGENLTGIAARIQQNVPDFSETLMMKLENSGSTRNSWIEGRIFAERTGLDVQRILEGTVVGQYLDRMSWRKVWSRDVV